LDVLGTRESRIDHGKVLSVEKLYHAKMLCDAQIISSDQQRQASHSEMSASDKNAPVARKLLIHAVRLNVATRHSSLNRFD
jgi:hypothetical protein